MASVTMATLTFDWQLYGHQADFALADKKVTALLGGVGSGKSMGGAARGILASAGYIGGVQVQTPNTGVVTAPTYRMLKDATVRTFKEMAGDFIVDFHNTDMIATMANGSEVFFRSAHEPDTLRGPNITWWWGDEGAYYSSVVSPIMRGRLRQFGQFGWAWITTTPKGRNWLYKEFIQEPTKHHMMWRVTTPQNPFVDYEFYLALRTSYAGDFARQELEGEFVAYEGLIYSLFSRDTHVVSEVPTRFASYVAGVDWGTVNPSVIGMYGIDFDGRIYKVDEFYKRRVQIDDLVEVAKQYQQQYRPDAFWCDPSKPEWITMLRGAGCNAYGADNSVLEGIQSVQGRLVRQDDGLPRLLIHPSCANTITEFEQYSWMENRLGLREQPVKSNDHAMDELRYVVRALDAPRRRAPEAKQKSYIGGRNPLDERPGW